MLRSVLVRRPTVWGRLASRLAAVTLAVVTVCAGGAAAAESVRGAAEAKTSEFKKGTVELARKRALRRARTAALSAALESLEGPIDRTARREVLKSGQGWTGAYRVLSETVTRSGDGDVVKIELEVDVDLARLAKRVAPRSAATVVPKFKFGTVREAPGCDSTLAQRLQSELEAVGALGGEDSTPVVFGAMCRDFGVVPHTFTSVGRVEIVGRVGREAVARGQATALGASSEGALAMALQEAIEEAASQLQQHRRGYVRIKVVTPLPSARIRRLERALRESVIGVRRVELSGLDRDGSVLLDVEGNLTPEALGRKLEALRLPGFSVTMQGLEGPDAISIVCFNKRRRIHVVAACGLAVGLLMGVGCRPAPGVGATLRIEAPQVDRDADVYVDGNYVGQINALSAAGTEGLKLAPGVHRVGDPQSGSVSGPAYGHDRAGRAARVHGASRAAHQPGVMGSTRQAPHDGRTAGEP